ncbi:hypothetical protein I7I48_01390 [Histoplasma ohiense]|nr:hypothetical protein I7I48_01390 [Histoplasma ohiense (nom. inval.)]
MRGMNFNLQLDTDIETAALAIWGLRFRHHSPRGLLFTSLHNEHVCPTPLILHDCVFPSSRSNACVCLFYP